MLRLILTRHGETDYNVQFRYAGSSDIPLNANGIKQAKSLAERVLGLGIDIIVSSPLIRAVQTAVIVQHTLDVPLHIIPEFAERTFGVYEGLTREEVQARYPDLWEKNVLRLTDDAPAGGESIRQFSERIGRGMGILKSQYDGKTVLLVCHGFAGREINRTIYNLPFDGMHGFVLKNAQINEYII